MVYTGNGGVIYDTTHDQFWIRDTLSWSDGVIERVLMEYFIDVFTLFVVFCMVIVVVFTCLDAGR